MGLLQIIAMVLSPSVTLSLVVLKVIFDPIFEVLGLSNPIDSQRRIEDHRHAVERVNALKEDLLRRDPHQSSELARTWLNHVEQLTKTGSNIQHGYKKSGINFFKSWYYARTAAKETKRADDLANHYKEVNQLSGNRTGTYRDVQLGELVAMDPYMTSLADFINHNEQKEPLGIWGMGGVGKTALLESLYNCRWKYKSFEFLFVPVGRNCTVLKLQESIAELLGLNLTEKFTLKGRIANHLFDRNFVLILDDVWDTVNLSEVGIPLPLGISKVRRQSWLHEITVHRKVILATRRLTVCIQMNCCSNTMHIICPSEQEAMRIFTATAGEEVMEVNRIPEYARQITEECGCLPDALCKIGRAMSIKYDPEDWKSDIESLRNSKLGDIIHVEEDLLGSLRYSYHHLHSSLKLCFLICSLWRAKENIPIDKLIQWWSGLGLLGDCEPGAYEKGILVITKLLDSSLLEKGDNNLWCSEYSHLRLHNLIRHMAVETVKDVLEETWVHSSSSRLSIPKDKWYSIQKAWLSQDDVGPWLKTYQSKKEPKLSMLVSQHGFRLLPVALCSKLVLLDLEGTRVENFPTEICTLKNLEYLNLSFTKISALPNLLTRLAKLKYLLLRCNMSLKTIPLGLIAKLQLLEELDVFHTGLPSLLNELRSPNVELGMLGLTVKTESEVQDLKRLSHVCLISLCLHTFEASTIDLSCISEMEKLRQIRIVKSSADRLVAESTREILPWLKTFELLYLPNLQNVRLRNTGLRITTVQISYCDKLVDVAWLDQLVRLEELLISHCKSMNTLFTAVSRNTNTEGVQFPKLKKIHLQDLPQLTTLTDCQLHLDNISYFCIVCCSKLRSHQDSQAWWKTVKIVEEVTEEMYNRFTREE